jgi:hypothetical protein
MPAVLRPFEGHCFYRKAVFQEGVEINAQCQWKPEFTCAMAHQTLKEWI